MRIDEYGQHVYTEGEVFDILLESPFEEGKNIGPFLLENPLQDIERTNALVGYQAFEHYQKPVQTLQVWDKANQDTWWMPDDYKELDIAAYVLDLCESQAELQRCGEELLMYQERDLFNLLRYLKYLVDVMELNGIIWGVGRGSSVSSYVLYKLKVHRVNSMYYDLDISEFLRD